MRRWLCVGAFVIACGARTELDVPIEAGSADVGVEDAAIDQHVERDSGIDSPIVDVSVPDVPIESAVPDAGPPIPAIGASNSTGCALQGTGNVKCWPKYGQAANVSLGVPIVSIAVGGGHAFARGEDDSLWSWGVGYACELGNGVMKGNVPPMQLTAFGNQVVSMSTADLHSLAALTDGTVVAWGAGSNGTGQSNNGKAMCAPTPVLGLGGPVAKVAQGDEQGCALRTDQTIQCWGSNANGELGDGTNDDSFIATTEVVGITDAIDIAVGDQHICAVTATGVVKCWGDDSFGELGDGTNNASNVPVDVVGLSAPAVAVTADLQTSCALLTTGEVDCWGKLGNATNLAPTVMLASDVISVSEQNGFGCGLYTTGAAKCWGASNDFDDAGVFVPIDVLGLP